MFLNFCSVSINGFIDKSVSANVSGASYN